MTGGATHVTVTSDDLRHHLLAAGLGSPAVAVLFEARHGDRWLRGELFDRGDVKGPLRWKVSLRLTTAPENRVVAWSDWHPRVDSAVAQALETLTFRLGSEAPA